MVNVSTYITLQCNICGEDVKENLTFFCTCKKRVCENCWKSVMCIDCFDKLPYDEQKLVENFDEKFKKRRNIIRILTYILFGSMILVILIFELPFWTISIFVGFMVLYSILFYFIPLIRFHKQLELNRNESL